MLLEVIPRPKGSPRNLREFFITVRDEVLTDESRWCKMALGRAPFRTILYTDELPQACKVCLMGGVAFTDIFGRQYTDFARRWLDHTIKKLYPTRVPADYYLIAEAFNDHPDTTFEDIRKVLDRVIEEV